MLEYKHLWTDADHESGWLWDPVAGMRFFPLLYYGRCESLIRFDAMDPNEMSPFIRFRVDLRPIAHSAVFFSD